VLHAVTISNDDGNNKDDYLEIVSCLQATHNQKAL